MKSLLVTSSFLMSVMFALPALSAEINIYSSRNPELIDPVVAAFEEKTGHDVNVVFIEDGLVERLEAEGARAPADLVLTVDIANLVAIVDKGVTQVLETETTKTMPAETRDPDGQWVGLTKRARIAYASVDRVQDGAIATYEDLADPKWKGKICVRSGLHNYNVALVAAYLTHHTPEETESWLVGLRDNLAHSPDGSDRAQAKSIWAGECDLSLGNTYYLGLMSQDPEQKPWREAVKPIFLTFEGAGTHVNLSGISLLKSSKNVDAAKEFVDYLLTDGQKLFAEINNEYPVNPAYEPSDMVKSWGTLVADTTSLSDIAAQRATALELIQKVDFDR